MTTDRERVLGVELVVQLKCQLRVWRPEKANSLRGIRRRQPMQWRREREAAFRPGRETGELANGAAGSSFSPGGACPALATHLSCRQPLGLGNLTAPSGPGLLFSTSLTKHLAQATNVPSVHPMHAKLPYSALLCRTRMMFNGTPSHYARIPFRFLYSSFPPWLC